MEKLDKELQRISFDELETVEDIVTGGAWGTINCCCEGASSPGSL